MTAKDYKLIAASFNYWSGLNLAMFKHATIEAHRTEYNIKAGALYDVANDLSRQFEAEDPKFDRERFLTACGVSGINITTKPVN